MSSTTINRPLLTQQVQQFCCLPSRTTQICPLCLEEPITYDRLYWQVRYLITCPKHMVLLQRFCGRCKSPIPCARIDPRTCPACKHRYISSLFPIPSACSFLLSGDLLTFHALGITDLDTPSGFSPLENDPRALLPSDQYLALLRAPPPPSFTPLRRAKLAPTPSFDPPFTTPDQAAHSSRTPPTTAPRPRSTGSLHSGPTVSSRLSRTLTTYARREGRKKPAFFPKTFFTHAPQAAYLLSPPHSRSQ